MTGDRLVLLNLVSFLGNLYTKIYIIRSIPPNSLPHYLVITKVKIFMGLER